MTGIAIVEGEVDGEKVRIEARSVNHRHLDTRFRLPSKWGIHEPSLQKMARKHLERGSIEVSVRLDRSETPVHSFRLNEEAAESFLAAVKDLEAMIGQKFEGGLLEAMVLTNRVFDTSGGDDGESDVLGHLSALLSETLEKLNASRQAEGQSLEKVFREVLAELATFEVQMRELASDQPRVIAERLNARLAQWNLSSLSSERIEQEVALYAERADIVEELDRFATHLGSFSVALSSASGGPGLGKRLDFLAQEMAREINTLSAKAVDVRLKQLSIEARLRVERLREQVQNVE